LIILFFLANPPWLKYDQSVDVEILSSVASPASQAEEPDAKLDLLVRKARDKSSTLLPNNYRQEPAAGDDTHDAGAPSVSFGEDAPKVEILEDSTHDERVEETGSPQAADVDPTHPTDAVLPPTESELVTAADTAPMSIPQTEEIEVEDGEQRQSVDAAGPQPSTPPEDGEIFEPPVTEPLSIEDDATADNPESSVTSPIVVDEDPGEQSDSVSVRVQPPTPRRFLASEAPSLAVSPMPSSPLPDVPAPSKETQAVLEDAARQHPAHERAPDHGTPDVAELSDAAVTGDSRTLQDVEAHDGSSGHPHKLYHSGSASDPLLPFSLNRVRPRSSLSPAEPQRSPPPAAEVISQEVFSDERSDAGQDQPRSELDQTQVLAADESSSEDELAITLVRPSKQKRQESSLPSTAEVSSQVAASDQLSEHHPGDKRDASTDQSTSEDELSFSLTHFDKDKPQKNAISVVDDVESEIASYVTENEPTLSSTKTRQESPDDPRGTNDEAYKLSDGDERDTFSGDGSDREGDSESAKTEQKDAVSPTKRKHKSQSRATDKAYEPSDVDGTVSESGTILERGEPGEQMDESSAEQVRPASASKRKRKSRRSGVDKPYKPSKDDEEDDDAVAEEERARSRRGRRSGRASATQSEANGNEGPKSIEQPQASEADGVSRHRRPPSRRGKVKDPTFKPDPVDDDTELSDVPMLRSGKKRRPVSSAPKPKSVRSRSAESFDNDANRSPGSQSTRLDVEEQEGAALSSVHTSPGKPLSDSRSPERRRSSRLAAKDEKEEEGEEEVKGEGAIGDSLTPRKRRRSSVSSYTMVERPVALPSSEIAKPEVADDDGHQPKRRKADGQEQNRRKGFLGSVKRFFGSRA
jgi:hypothetical protein